MSFMATFSKMLMILFAIAMGYLANRIRILDDESNRKLTKLVLMPIELNFDKGRSMGGWPRPKYDSGILERLAKMSEPFGTKIEIRDGLGFVEV